MNNFIVPKRGSTTVGLVRYLFGKGRRDEHRDQRVIAAAETLGVTGGTRLDHTRDREQIGELGRQLDSHRKAYGVEMAGGHVWHCAISLPPGEKLTDAQWARVARAAMDELGFTETSGHAPCRWLAVHHGPSVKGSEHIHLAVNLVREDGTIASTWRERRTMSRVCARFEREFGLRVVTGRAGRGMPGYSRAEDERVRAGVRPEPDRATLARTVRACAAAAASEAEFVRRLAGAGVLARPRYAGGGRGAVTGYSVALRATKDAPSVWMGGGRLAPDLTLPRLRGHWDAMAPGADAAAARAQALAEWRHLTGDGPAGTPSPAETSEYGPGVWDAAAERLAAVRERLAAVPPGDTAAWSTAARQAAGILAGLSARLETEAHGPLAEAADALARSAQTRPGEARYARHSGLNDLRGVALAVRQATIPAHRPDPWIALMRQILKLIEVISRMHAARRQLHDATVLRGIAEGRLAALAASSATPVSVSAADFPPGLPPIGRRGARPAPPAVRPPGIRRPGPDKSPGR